MLLEARLVAGTLLEETGSPLAALMYEVWVEGNHTALCRNKSSGAFFMIAQDKIEELRHMHTLFSKVPGAAEDLKEVLRESLENYGIYKLYIHLKYIIYKQMLNPA